ncbi:hypothetical protein HU200_028441 [Digitaria exilis]|uniref:Uncharacterized protein n=1 Tax=Digitaria exilis TaxID=1010633 RepID=A0A835BRU7_9POAL|nr:hypothetical protein HU200_028441 [Digitaria exilis]
MERWVAAERREGEVTFPQLENLVIRGCPKLVTLPETPNLKVVKLDEDKTHLSLQIVRSRSRYIYLVSELQLSVHDKEAALELDDENIESPLLELTLSGCGFFFSSLSQPAAGIWRWFGKLVYLGINDCDGLIYWPEDVFQSLVSLKHLEVLGCNNIVGPTPVKGEPAPTKTRVLPHLDRLRVWDCPKLAELFVLSPSITELRIGYCKTLKFTLEEDAESKSVHMQLLDKSTSQKYTGVPKISAALPLPRLEFLIITTCDSVVTLPDLPPALRSLTIWSCPRLCSISGQLDALMYLSIYWCNELQSLDSLGHLPSLVNLELETCKRLTSLPGVLGGYSALRRLTIKYCPAIDMKVLYMRHQQRLDSLEFKDLSHARSSDEGVF